MAYADDVKLVANDRTEAAVVNILQAFVKSVFAWSKCNRLRLNPYKSKWKVIFPVLKQSTRSAGLATACCSALHLSSKPLERVDSKRQLGVPLTDTLSWSAQVETVCKKVNSMLGAIRRAESGAKANVRHRHFAAFVMPQLLCCFPVLGNCNETAAHMLNNCLQKVLRTITGDSTASLSKDSYQAYSLLPYRSLLMLSKVRIVHGLLHSDSLLMKTNKFAPSLLSERNTRGSDSLKLKQVKAKKSTKKLCFLVSAVIH